MSMSVSELAERTGLSAARIRAMAADGSLSARKVGSQWIIDQTSLSAAKRSGRAMTRENAWALARVAAGERPSGLRAEEAYRLRRRLTRLLASEDPALLLRTWMHKRAERRDFHAGDVEALRNDARVQLSGVSDRASGLRQVEQVEGYVSGDDIDALIEDHLLFGVAKGEGNVTLRVASSDDLSGLQSFALLTAADLAESTDVRARGQVERALRAALQQES